MSISFSNEAKPKEPSAIERLKAWRDIGDTFEYLGKTCVVTRHYKVYGHGKRPCIIACYADNNGILRDAYFSVDEIEAIQRTQP